MRDTENHTETYTASRLFHNLLPSAASSAAQKKTKVAESDHSWTKPLLSDNRAMNLVANLLAKNTMTRFYKNISALMGIFFL